MEKPRPPGYPRSHSITSPPHEREPGHTLALSQYMMYSDLCTSDPVVVTVPQPELSGATDQISQEETTRRINSKAQELRSDHSLTEVGGMCCYDCK